MDRRDKLAKEINQRQTWFDVFKSMMDLDLQRSYLQYIDDLLLELQAYDLGEGEITWNLHV